MEMMEKRLFHVDKASLAQGQNWENSWVSNGTKLLEVNCHYYMENCFGKNMNKNIEQITEK